MYKETQNISYENKNKEVKVLDNQDLKKLVELHKNKEFFDIETVESEDISTRDIIEFAYHTRIVSMVQKAQEVLLTTDPKDTDELQNKLQSVMEEILSTSDEITLTPRQNEFVEDSISRIIESIKELNEFLATASYEDIKSRLGAPFSELSDDVIELDTTSYPGIVALFIKNKELFDKSTNSTGVRGKYGSSRGEDTLKGHLILINDEIAPKETEHHEYFHYLYHQVAPLTPIPNKEINARKAKKQIEAKYSKILRNLKYRREDLETEMYNFYLNNKNVKEKLKNIEDEIFEKEFVKNLLTQIAFAEHTTYEDNDIQKIFDKFKNEFFAYATSNTGYEGRPSTFLTYIGGKKRVEDLKKSKKGESFLWELQLISKTIKEALKRGYTSSELSYHIIGTRSLTQASKFIYLYMQSQNLDKKNQD